MLNVTYRSENGRLDFSFEVDSAKSAFASVAALQELFEEPSCGQCNSQRLKYQVRENSGNKYHSIVCSDCGAQLDVGQLRDGSGLFIKRTDRDKQPIGNNGWYHWHERRKQTEGSGGEKTTWEF